MTNIFRNGLTPCDSSQLEKANQIKDKAQELYDVISETPVGSTNETLDDRCIAIAKTKLEEVVMWAVKGFTKTK